MIGYVTIGADDPDAVASFYDGVFAAIGGERKSPVNGWIVYGRKGAEASIGICKPHNGEPARAGNGIMVALRSDTQGGVAEAHAIGLAHGGTDEGAPGYRPSGGTFYGCYLRDPTGNKLCVYFEAE